MVDRGRGRLLGRLTLGAVALLCAVLALGSRPAVFGAGPARVEIPLPVCRLRVERADDRASWLLCGDPDLGRWFRERAPERGWTVVDQLGSAWFLERDGQRLAATRRQVAPLITRLDLVLEPRDR